MREKLFSLFAVVSFLTLHVSAQQPPVKAVPAAPISPNSLPTIPAGQQNAEVVAPSPTAVCDVALQFPKLTGEDLSFLYRRLTGRRVVIPADATAMELYYVQPPPITYGTAIDLLKAACLMQGFVFVPGGVGWDKLVSVNVGANKPGNVGNLPLITSEAALPEGDQVVSYVMTLKYIKPEEAARIFQSVVVQLNAYGSIVPVPNSSALVITENASLIKTLAELANKIDKPSSDVITKFIKVQYADVEELSTTLSDIFSSQSKTQATAGVQRLNQPQLNAPQVPGAVVSASSGGGSSEAAPVQIVPDSRTNRIFVMARPIDLVFIESLVKEFDSRSDQRNFMRRKLKFLSVGGFMNVAQDALQRAFGGDNKAGGAGGGATAGGQQQQRSPQTASSGSNGRSGNRGGRNGGGGSQGGGQSGGGGGGSSGGGLDSPQTDTAPQSVLVGRTLLVADNITNSIVVQGPPASVEIINNLLDEIDVKADQVMISTVFGQLTLGDDLNFGVDWFQKLKGDRGFAGAIGDPILTPPTNVNVAATGALAGGLGVYGAISKNLTAYVSALQETGKFNVISRPTIFTANNQKGSISSGQQIAVPTSTFNNSGGNNNGGGLSTNIEFRDVELSLEVIPLVNSKDEVTLQISLISQDLGKERLIQGAGLIRDIINRELTTTVTVPNNQTVVLGGLITESNNDGIRGVPILSSIPGLGKLFSSNTKSKNRNELLIFIQPQIIRDAKSMDYANTDIDSRYEISDKLHKSANGPGVLPLPDEIEGAKDSLPISTKKKELANRKKFYTPNMPQKESAWRRMKRGFGWQSTEEMRGSN
jgi:general secretion pathway protein D